MSVAFSWVDYAVFVGLLLASALIGIYYALTGGRQRTTKEYLMADRRASWIPVSLSLLASFMSAIMLLGVPSELYISGAIYWLMCVGNFITIPITAHVFIPIFHRLQLISAFHYVEIRFGYVLRIMVTITFIIGTMLYLAIVLYAPALALNAAAGISMSGALLAVGGVCIFYTAIGGLKAVIYTDVLQTLVMIGGMLVILVVAIIEVGGVSHVIELTTIGKRLEIDDFRISPTIRHSIWSLIFGSAFTGLAVYGSNQTQVQRYVSVSHKSDAQKAVYLNIPISLTLMAIQGSIGLLAYTYYVFCDPLGSKKIWAPDQLLPIFVMDLLGSVPGFPGLFVSSVFSGALSTVSSGVNALAAVTLEDILKGFWPSLENQVSASFITHMLKLLAVVYGLIALALAWFVGQFGQIMQAALGLFGMTGGPILGVFLLGFFVKIANHKGATVGFTIALALTLTIGFGAQIYKPPASQQLPRFSSCNFTNLTMSMNNDLIYDTLRHKMEEHISAPAEEDTRPFLARTLLSISYLWYSLIGSVTVLIVGTLASLPFAIVDKKEINPLLMFQPQDMFWWDSEYSFKQKEAQKDPPETSKEASV